MGPTEPNISDAAQIASMWSAFAAVHWARWAAWAAWAGVLVNAAALIFLGLQLKANTKAVGAAAEAASAATAQTRPYIMVELDNAQLTDSYNLAGQRFRSFSGMVKSTNVGLTPAQNLTVSAYKTDGSLADQNACLDRAKDTLQSGPFVFPDKYSGVIPGFSFEGPDDEIFVICVASYNAVGSSIRHRTPAIFAVRPDASAEVWSTHFEDGSHEHRCDAVVEARPHMLNLPMT